MKDIMMLSFNNMLKDIKMIVHIIIAQCSKTQYNLRA